jgi:D-3-phosphoglycerate dehydrogenase
MLINAARGEIVQEAALLDALQARRLAGAALDVYEHEPLPADHPFRSLDNVVLTPHLGASTEEAQQNVALEIATAVRAAMAEGDFSRAVNAPGIGGERMRRMRPLLDLQSDSGASAWLSPASAWRRSFRYAPRAGCPARPRCIRHDRALEWGPEG